MSASDFKIPASRASRGFTILELLIVVGIVGVMSIVAIPHFQGTLHAQQLLSSTENARAVLKKAQSLSSKLNVPVVVEPVYGTSPSLRVYADYWNEDASSNGSDLAFTVGTADRILAEWSLQGESKLPIHFWSIRDTDKEGDTAIVGFTDNPAGDDQPPLIVFSPPSGRIQDRGMLSISLTNSSGELHSCRSVSVITMIGQTQVDECSDEPSIYEEAEDA